VNNESGSGPSSTTVEVGSQDETDLEKRLADSWPRMSGRKMAE